MQRLKRWYDFNRWYLRRGRPPWDTGISPPELYAFMASHPPGRALDLGCGTGTNVVTLAQHGWHATGVDFALKAIAEARCKARAAGVQNEIDLRVGDVVRLDGIAGSFDLIFDLGCFHGLTSEGMDAYAQCVKRLLAPSGTYLLYVHFKDDPTSNRSGLFEDDLRRFAPEFVVSARADGADTSNGRRSAWLTYHKAAGHASSDARRA